MMLKKKPFNSHVANVKDSAVELCGEDDAETPLANLVRIGFKAAASDAKMTVIGSCSDPAKIYFGEKSLAEIIAAV